MELIEVLFTAITAVVNFSLGLITYLKDPKSWTNRLLAFLALQLSIWSVINYISLHAGTEAATLNWIRFDMVPGAPMAPTIYLLVRSFPYRKLGVSKFVLGCLLVLVIATAATALSPYMFTEAVFENGEIRAIPGPGIILFMLNFIGCLIL